MVDAESPVAHEASARASVSARSARAWALHVASRAMASFVRRLSISARCLASACSRSRQASALAARFSWRDRASFSRCSSAYSWSSSSAGAGAGAAAW